MDMQVSFTMEFKRPVLGAKEWSEEKMNSFCQEIAEELAITVTAVKKGGITFTFCSGGIVHIRWFKSMMFGVIPTGFAGPGFHAAVCYFLELFAARGHAKLLLKDETGFYEDRDFEKLRRDFFIPWLKGLLSQAVESEGEEGKLLCWPEGKSYPRQSADVIWTPIRPFSVRELRGIIKSGLVATVAKDFFIWPNEERDALFLRNSALYDMNQFCYFQPSARSETDAQMNRHEIEILETVWNMDPTIAIPKQEYLELCALDGHEPMPLENVNDMAGAVPIGMRRDWIFCTMGQLEFTVPGSFLYHPRKNPRIECYTDPDEKTWREVDVCMFYKSMMDESVLTRLPVADVETFSREELEGKIWFYEPKKEVFCATAKIEYKEQVAMINVFWKDPIYKDWARDLIHKVRVVETKEEEGAFF